MNYKISIIIPLYNEEKTILSLLKSIKKSPIVDEIICVNDGSTDNTLSVISQVSAIKIISLRKNYGKAYAVCRGLEHATGDIIVFIDGDLTGFTEEHLHFLTQPLLDNRYDNVIGYQTRKLGWFFIPVSGERAYYRHDIYVHIQTLEKKGYGLELYLNHLFRDKRTKIVPLKGVTHTLKHKKFMLIIAIKEYVNELNDIFFEIFTTKKPFSYVYYSYLYQFYIKKG